MLRPSKAHTEQRATSIYVYTRYSEAIEHIGCVSVCIVVFDLLLLLLPLSYYIHLPCYRLVFARFPMLRGTISNIINTQIHESISISLSIFCSLRSIIHYVHSHVHAYTHSLKHLPHCTRTQSRHDIRMNIALLAVHFMMLLLLALCGIENVNEKSTPNNNNNNNEMHDCFRLANRTGCNISRTSHSVN